MLCCGSFGWYWYIVTVHHSSVRANNQKMKENIFSDVALFDVYFFFLSEHMNMNSRCTHIFQIFTFCMLEQRNTCEYICDIYEVDYSLF